MDQTEQALLGAVLLSPKAYDMIADIVRAEHFTELRRRNVWLAIKAVADAGKDVDVLSVADHMDREGLAKQIDGGAYITWLANNVASYANVRQIAELMAAKWLDRHAKAIKREIQGDDAQSIRASLAEALDGLDGAISNSADADHSTRAAGRAWMAAIESLGEDCGQGMGYGLECLDKAHGRLQEGDLYVIAGAPASGKTTLGLQSALANAKNGYKTKIFSLEMGLHQVYSSMASNIMGMPDVFSRMVRNEKTIEDYIYQESFSAVGVLGKLPIEIAPCPGIRIANLELQIAKFARKGGQAVYIDYLQLVRADRDTKEYDRVSAVSMQLKEIAGKYKVAVVALSQLKRTDKRPTMHDLRSSGQIEQDASGIVLLYSPVDDSSYREIIAAKNRFGEPCILSASFNGGAKRFSEWDGLPPMAKAPNNPYGRSK